MEEGKIEEELAAYLEKFGLCKKNDDKLRYTKYYYTDPEVRKYVLYPMVFHNTKELLEMWEIAQNEDIAAHLQSKVFPYKDIRWDMYFLLIYVETDLTDDNIVAIERDKFCCKKVLINAEDSTKFIEDLKAKLPFTDNYYPSNDTLTLDDHEFFHELRKMTSLSDAFSDEVFNSASKKPEEFGSLLKGIEVKIVG